MVFVIETYKIFYRAVIASFAGRAEKASGDFSVVSVVSYAFTAYSSVVAADSCAGAFSKIVFSFTFHFYSPFAYLILAKI